MQSEAGEGLPKILRRKDLERRAGAGLFFWGVGNAPARAIPALAKAAAAVDVIFSVMKSKPKAIDVAPDLTVAWQSYVDADGTARPIPPNVLVTSRASRRGCHYALVCRSDEPLSMADEGPFDPAAYRNYGAGRGVGASQVTALLERCAPDRTPTYRVAMKATLTGALWVKLIDPVIVSPDARQALEAQLTNEEEWLRTVSIVRSSGRSPKSIKHSQQPSLFAI
ncbi:hypothetical protein HCH44_06170 [Sphingomonas melonis]|uniref:hypothetical protein n=1 Tax=Sphingomonas melonis TaxID=152682 RepID=UPI001C8C9871|nr:hypothetical protein [Sphingomonas melonis]MBX8844494.1 hypothetical protein [Sphingomonas melonis]MBX8852405.1 hypothetical protein [Sphingomonas melonis]MBX8897836.1 hypothetical protein [Sphingomonas melonis]